jgi:hypothetical protein
MKDARTSRTFKSIFLFSIVAISESGLADRYFVMPVVLRGENSAVALQFEESVRSAIPTDGRNGLVSSVASSQFQIEPRIVEFERNFQLTLDKRNGSTIVYSKTLSLPKDQSVTDAGTWLAQQITTVQPYANRLQVGSLISTGSQPPVKKSRLTSRYYFSYGPASGSGLNSSDLLVNLNVGHAWEVDKSMFRIYYNNTVGQNDDADLGLRGVGISGGQLLSNQATAPFINADLIYGATSYTFYDTAAVVSDRKLRSENKSGFIYGLGAGMMFSRDNSVAFETALQFNSFMGSTPNGTPSTFGFRGGVHY